MSHLTLEEEEQLVQLLNKLTLPASLAVFESWCRTFGVTCAEVVLFKNLDTQPEIFLTYRQDKFFTGWHLPGRVHLPSETIHNTFQRVLDGEIKIKVREEKFFSWFERPLGQGIGECPRGHEFALVFTCQTFEKDHQPDSSSGQFFPLDAIPADLIKLQIPIISKLKETFLVS